MLGIAKARAVHKKVAARVFDPDHLSQQSVGNAILRRLPPEDYAQLRPHLTGTPLAVGETIATAGEDIDLVCFLEGGVAGFLDVLGDGRRLAIGLVGREGFVGWPLLMGNDRWPYDVQLRAAPTTALRVDARQVEALVASSSATRDLLLRFAGVFMAQMSRTIVSNLIHPVERRTARWAATCTTTAWTATRSRSHTKSWEPMLGVRRSSVTDALHVLEGENLIHSLRGRVVIRDRQRLQLCASEAYGYAEAEYDRLINTAR